MGNLGQGMNPGIGSPGANEGDFLFWIDNREGRFDVSLDGTPLRLNLPAMKI